MQHVYTPRTLDLDALVLQRGNHDTPEHGMCSLEVVAYLAGEPHSDRPMCACPVIAEYMRRLNDRLSDANRQLLKPLLERLVGSKSTPEVEAKRRAVLRDRVYCELLPKWLEIAGLKKEARQVRAMATKGRVFPTTEYRQAADRG